MHAVQMSERAPSRWKKPVTRFLAAAINLGGNIWEHGNPLCSRLFTSCIIVTSSSYLLYLCTHCICVFVFLYLHVSNFCINLGGNIWEHGNPLCSRLFTFFYLLSQTSLSPGFRCSSSALCRRALHLSNGALCLMV